MKRIFFFATPADIVPVLRRFEARVAVKYAEVSNQISPVFAEYQSIDDIPNPGVSTHETGGASASYLVAAADWEWRAKPFAGSNGERRWCLNNGENEASVSLTMAGLWKDALLPGKMDTLHDTSAAQQLMKNFLAAIKAEKFVKNQLFWLGKQAHEMLQSGIRLPTAAVQSPPEYDLKPL